MVLDLFTSSSEKRTWTDEEARSLLHSACDQVSKLLKPSAKTHTSFQILSSYYTKTSPRVHGEPFCVALTKCTVLYHLQMGRVAESDIQLYIKLFSTAMGLLTEDHRSSHPLITLLRRHIFGLPLAGARDDSPGHYVVLLHPHHYRNFASIALSLLGTGLVPQQILDYWKGSLESLKTCASPLVSCRAEGLVILIGDAVEDLRSEVAVLQRVIKNKPNKLNLEFLDLCYDRLQRLVPDAAACTTSGRALSIHCSEIFLTFRTPLRRMFLEKYLYPSLCHNDMQPFIASAQVRNHLASRLLRFCVPSMNGTNPYYLCLCALVRSSLDDETEAALQLIRLFRCQMPHAAYFVGALSVDQRFSSTLFAKTIMLLVRAAAQVMGNRVSSDLLFAEISGDKAVVYSMIFTIREVVRQCALSGGKRSAEILTTLRTAIQPTTIDALSRFAAEAYADCSDAPDPQVLCSELGLILHDIHLREAIDCAVSFMMTSTETCGYCGRANNSSPICPINGTVHVGHVSSFGRLLATLAECACSAAFVENLIRVLQNPTLQLHCGAQYVAFHCLAYSGAHKSRLFRALEPYLQSTMNALLYHDLDSNARANILIFHVKLTMILGPVHMDATKIRSILQTFSQMRLQDNHVAVALWTSANVLLRNCKATVDLLPRSPSENGYSMQFPACAPISTVAADNAQLLLDLIDRTHMFSDETKKLLGCCTCRLIQDFNMQTMNIVSSLMQPIGFVNNNVESLQRYGLPVSSLSTFWSFVQRQLLTSPPARSSFLSTFARSVALRFANEIPSGSVAHGPEETSVLFSVMIYEASKRNSSLASSLLHMMTNWAANTELQPGKFICLVYGSLQLTFAVEKRSQSVGTEGETFDDRASFERAIHTATTILSSQQARLNFLAQAVQTENPLFSSLTREVLAASLTATNKFPATTVETAAPNHEEVSSPVEEAPDVVTMDDPEYDTEKEDAMTSSSQPSGGSSTATLIASSSGGESRVSKAPDGAPTEVGRSLSKISRSNSRPDRGMQKPKLPHLQAHSDAKSVEDRSPLSIFDFFQQNMSADSALFEIRGATGPLAAQALQVTHQHFESVVEAVPEPRSNNYFLPHQEVEKENQSDSISFAKRRRSEFFGGLDQQSITSAQLEMRTPMGFSGTGVEDYSDIKGLCRRPFHSCLVEQQNDTALRELRPESRSLTTQGTTGKLSYSWSSRSTAPPPTYAMDNQYSLELF